jgi:hypothetical protein
VFNLETSYVNQSYIISTKERKIKKNKEISPKPSTMAWAIILAFAFLNVEPQGIRFNPNLM